MFFITLACNRDLVVFDLMGALETYNMERRGGAGCSQGRGALCAGAPSRAGREALGQLHGRRKPHATAAPLSNA